MASTSNGGGTPIDGVNAMPDIGLADTALCNDLQLYEYVNVPECYDPTSPSTVDAGGASLTDLFQVSENEEFVSVYGVPMELLNLDEREKADLVVINPKATVEGNCITTTQHIFVVKRFLFDLTLHGMQGVRLPEAYARLLRRLSRELRSCCFDSDSSIDPADYAGCLGEMLDDMEKTWERLERDGEILKQLDETWGSGGYVYVSRETDAYVNCLLAAATALNSR